MMLARADSLPLEIQVEYQSGCIKSLEEQLDYYRNVITGCVYEGVLERYQEGERRMAQENAALKAEVAGLRADLVKMRK